MGIIRPVEVRGFFVLNVVTCRSPNVHNFLSSSQP